MKKLRDSEIKNLAYEVEHFTTDFEINGFVLGFKCAMNLLSKTNKKSLEARKQDFMQKVANFTEQYPKEMLREFFEYWSEHGENDRKFRMEKEKSFDIGKRLARWAKNYKPSKNMKPMDRLQQNSQGWGN